MSSGDGRRTVGPARRPYSRIELRAALATAAVRAATWIRTAVAVARGCGATWVDVHDLEDGGLFWVPGRNRPGTRPRIAEAESGRATAITRESFLRFRVDTPTVTGATRHDD
ncbi:hypothetical protein FF36_04618 [Frankia torreyi]|uniref:Uncharacterized protein n=1 Tax=Frankia torreyi TaxID=1856 RepID=A0A0D8BA04_9ACTN|nr:hypothetical protein [Frankia torreyi]KJE21113.1 hypothetical protein FF36_04618 [Frankia torreyi]KQM03619.1 hypothetical protein FF86_103726 [Frankia sp. CpI1-P]